MLHMDLAATAHDSHLAQRLKFFTPPLRHTLRMKSFAPLIVAVLCRLLKLHESTLCSIAAPEIRHGLQPALALNVFMISIAAALSYSRMQAWKMF